jgi:hypothetical protein
MPAGAAETNVLRGAPAFTAQSKWLGITGLREALTRRAKRHETALLSLLRRADTEEPIR